MRPLIALALVSMTACGKSSPATVPPPPPPPPDAATPVDAAAPDVSAPDSAPAVGEPSADDHAPAPGFGCIGTSPAHDLIACFVGQSGYNLTEDTRITLAFAPLARGARPPAAIPVLAADYGPGEDTIPPALAATLAAATKDYVPLPQPAGQITLETDDKSADPPVSVGGLTIALRTGKAAAGDSTRTYIAVGRGKAIERLDDSDKMAMLVMVTARELGDIVLIEETYTEAGEGVQGAWFHAWLCPRTAKTCTEIR